MSPLSATVLYLTFPTITQFGAFIFKNPGTGRLKCVTRSSSVNGRCFPGGEERVCSEPECFQGTMEEHEHFGAIQT